MLKRIFSVMIISLCFVTGANAVSNFEVIQHGQYLNTEAYPKLDANLKFTLMEAEEQGVPFDQVYVEGLMKLDGSFQDSEVRELFKHSKVKVRSVIPGSDFTIISFEGSLQGVLDAHKVDEVSVIEMSRSLFPEGGVTIRN